MHFLWYITILMENSTLEFGFFFFFTLQFYSVWFNVHRHISHITTSMDIKHVVNVLNNITL